MAGWFADCTVETLAGTTLFPCCSSLSLRRATPPPSPSAGCCSRNISQWKNFSILDPLGRRHAVAELFDFSCVRNSTFFDTSFPRFLVRPFCRAISFESCNKIGEDSGIFLFFLQVIKRDPSILI